MLNGFVCLAQDVVYIDFSGIEEQGGCLLIYVNMVKGKDEFIERT